MCLRPVRRQTELIGYETSEQLDVEPAKFRKLKSFNVGALTQLFNPFLNSTLPVADRRTSHKASEHCSEVLGAAEAQRKGNVCHRISTVSKLYAGRINLSAQDIIREVVSRSRF